ncbi:hypothetical protein SAMN05216311_10644 [Chitinophaga sp. CF418]|nr:hypothetical protein SAMN05216311_10644 [Chitinophaga sp. CF418]
MKIFTFVFYLAASIFVYLVTYGWVVEKYSVIQYSVTSLGIGTGKLILLLIYGVLTFSTTEKIVGMLQSKSFLIRMIFLVLGILAIPISIIVVVLYNNNNYEGTRLPLDNVLNIISLLTCSALLNLLVFSILKFFQRRHRL